MYDFLKVTKEFLAKQQRYVYKPAFKILPKMKDLMVRSRDFYALYDDETGMWITNEGEALAKIDEQVRDYVVKEVGDQLMNDPEHGPIIKKLSDSETRLIDSWHKFCQKDVRDSYHPLNQVVKFSNSEIKKEDYATYKLPYPLKEGPTPYYDKLVNTLYLPDERRKFEYLLGCILAGEQKKIQKLFIFYGDPGTGKSTVIDIIVKTVLGGTEAPYSTQFTAELLAGRDAFGTGFLARDPVVAFDPDADLSRIESNTTLNLITSHEAVRVNDKFRPTFTAYPNCLLICAVNEPVQLNPRSGLNRRLIDIRPTGEVLPKDEYDDCLDHLDFEKAGIAYHCLQVYKSSGKNYYNKYVPEDMLTSTSPFHNYVKDNFIELKDGITLANAYKLYNDYVEEAKLKTALTRYKFRDSLKLYFDEYVNDMEGSGKAYFSGFKYEKIGLKRPGTEEETIDDKKETETSPPKEKDETVSWLKFNESRSWFDEAYVKQPAQYASSSGTPLTAWKDVTTTLGDLDTKKEHYVKLPTDVITVDFDLKDEDGNKSFQKNYDAARKFPPTYAELSKSGSGIHLHYIYTGGNVEELSSLYDDNIEVKVQKGNSALRRKLTWCNDIPIQEISSGLPLKEAKKKMIDWDGFRNEKILYTMICRNLAKEYHSSTKSSIDYIDYLLRQAYESGASYDLRKLYQPVFEFARKSTHKADYCEELVSHMHFCSSDVEDKEAKGAWSELAAPENVEIASYKEALLVIFDIESYPEDVEQNLEALLVICWKYYGKDKTVVSMVNPTPDEVKELFKYRLVGFNNREYDNHIIYARSIGYSIAECNRLSQRIVNAKTSEEKRKAKFPQATNVSYTDIYDFASAGNKMGLKKWEIELGIHHQEMGIPWDRAVPKELWPKVVEYCTNDVLATEAVFDHLHGDFVAREILADLAGKTANDTTNTLTTTIIFGKERHPQLVYTDFSTGKQYS